MGGEQLVILRNHLLSLEGVLSDQEVFLEKLFRTNQNLVNRYQDKSKEFFDALYKSCLEGIQKGINSFIAAETSEGRGNGSRNIFDYKPTRFFSSNKIKDYICHQLTKNPILLKHLQIDPVPDYVEVFCDEIAYIVSENFLSHVDDCFVELFSSIK